MTVQMHRRSFLSATASAFAALAASGCSTIGVGSPSRDGKIGYGGLVSDPNGLLDLLPGLRR